MPQAATQSVAALLHTRLAEGVALAHDFHARLGAVREATGIRRTHQGAYCGESIQKDLSQRVSYARLSANRLPPHDRTRFVCVGSTHAEECGVNRLLRHCLWGKSHRLWGRSHHGDHRAKVVESLLHCGALYVQQVVPQCDSSTSHVGHISVTLQCCQRSCLLAAARCMRSSCSSSGGRARALWARCCAASTPRLASSPATSPPTSRALLDALAAPAAFMCKLSLLQGPVSAPGCIQSIRAACNAFSGPVDLHAARGGAAVQTIGIADEPLSCITTSTAT
jgi:hypothetical protein